MKSGNLKFLEPSGPLQACNGTALPLPYISNLLNICYVWQVYIRKGIIKLAYLWANNSYNIAEFCFHDRLLMISSEPHLLTIKPQLFELAL